MFLARKCFLDVPQNRENNIFTTDLVDCLKLILFLRIFLDFVFKFKLKEGRLLEIIYHYRRKHFNSTIQKLNADKKINPLVL